ncbi:hypothetical protein AB0M19_35410 [Streptomyces sp. NPDC051920]|uniref:hypothetical protein n=1 Tax=Streptomyces sp. NPDC051920 TaxID=3155523 RepID=UPI0034320FF7
MSDERDDGGLVMSGEMSWIAACWLLGFGAVNAVLYAVWWLRTRDERKFLRGVRTTDVDPIQAAWWLGAAWEGASPQQENYAAEVAVSLLIVAGDAEIDQAGRITVPLGRLGSQRDPVLAALVTLLRRHKGATVNELLTDPVFQRFRTALEARRTPLRQRFGFYRVPALTAAFVTAFGMSLHAMLLRCPVPGLPDRDPGWWTMAWIPVWAALAASAAVWPVELSRPWTRFTRRCRAVVTEALSDRSPHLLYRVYISASEPSDRRPPEDTATSRAAADVSDRRPSPYDALDEDLDLGLATHADAHHDGTGGGDMGGGD